MSEIFVPKISDFQIPPPFKDEKKFEEFILSFFNELENTTSYDLFGRRGQKQYGLDIFSGEKRTVIQCKCKTIGTRPDSKIKDELLRELHSDFEEFVKFSKANENKFTRFLFVSTYKDDANISSECIKKATGGIIVEYWSWDGLMRKSNDTIKTKYFGDLIGWTKEYYEPANFESPADSIDIDRDDEGVFSKPVSFEIDKSNPILEQIHEYISFKYSEVNFIPIHLLTRSYPFRKNSLFFPHYFFFSLSTDNTELFEFFDSIRIKKNRELIFTKKKLIIGVNNYEEKTSSILKRLTDNLIFNLESRYSQKRIKIRYTHNDKCDCVRCRFNRFEYNETFKRLSKIPKEIEEKFRLAYIQYQIGNFLQAANLLKELSSECKSQNIRQFIIQYNLSKLSVFIRNHYYGDNKQDLLVEKLKKINLKKELIDFSNSENEKLLDWINSNTFYSESRIKIQKTVSKIRNHYYSQLEGGWSSNSNIWELISEYAQIDSFLNENYIIYDGFSEFLELSDEFIEGLFASHAIGKESQSRLENFDDWLFQKIVYYGKPESILKYFGRYKLKEITYKRSSGVGDSFLELLTKLLDENIKTRNAFNKYCESNNRYFWQRYNTIFSNMIVLTSICKLEKKQINDIAEKLLNFLETEKSLYPNNIRYVRLFISKKGHLINKTTLRRFLLITLENGKTHGKDFIKAVVTQIKNHHGEIKLSRKDYIRFDRLVIGECPICKQKHSPDFMVYLYEIVDVKKKNLIQLTIENSLKNKYDQELYYLSTIYEILKPNGDLFEKFLEAAKPVANQVPFKQIFEKSSNRRYSTLNMLINLCYKYNIELKAKKFEVFKGIDGYYDWLLDMEGFDYNNFDVKWISEYKTIFYFEEIRKHVIIKDKILAYLKENKNAQLEHDYIELYCKN